MEIDPAAKAEEVVRVDLFVDSGSTTAKICYASFDSHLRVVEEGDLTNWPDANIHAKCNAQTPHVPSRIYVDEAAGEVKIGYSAPNIADSFKFYLLGRDELRINDESKQNQAIRTCLCYFLQHFRTEILLSKYPHLQRKRAVHITWTYPVEWENEEEQHRQKRYNARWEELLVDSSNLPQDFYPKGFNPGNFDPNDFSPDTESLSEPDAIANQLIPYFLQENKGDAHQKPKDNCKDIVCVGVGGAAFNIAALRVYLIDGIPRILQLGNSIGGRGGVEEMGHAFDVEVRKKLQSDHPNLEPAICNKICRQARYHFEMQQSHWGNDEDSQTEISIKIGEEHYDFEVSTERYFGIGFDEFFNNINKFLGNLKERGTFPSLETAAADGGAFGLKKMSTKFGETMKKYDLTAKFPSLNTSMTVSYGARQAVIHRLRLNREIAVGEFLKRTRLAIQFCKGPERSGEVESSEESGKEKGCAATLWCPSDANIPNVTKYKLDAEDLPGFFMVLCADEECLGEKECLDEGTFEIDETYCYPLTTQKIPYSQPGPINISMWKENEQFHLRFTRGGRWGGTHEWLFDSAHVQLGQNNIFFDVRKMDSLKPLKRKRT
ncbi:uncharacterized protein BCR38DRAFT_404025 [Pseudomassariella vexata]|uniref:Uncharacterized protein n=1 Tax=Pseudomassariella vexata TaxID=1141098 RepID=A0A1Y2EH30_9PEZI|nr:uncharacterized protein BCR38DRAFT_404025 [Pseudomassariella vexata]ORY70881.1 hypothetical protein BCR38DRAFT_404025 [Pseudomassariella vexata]